MLLVLCRTVLCRFLVLGRCSAPLSRSGRSLWPLCLVVLLYYGVMRLVFFLSDLEVRAAAPAGGYRLPEYCRWYVGSGARGGVE